MHKRKRPNVGKVADPKLSKNVLTRKQESQSSISTYFKSVEKSKLEELNNVSFSDNAIVSLMDTMEPKLNFKSNPTKLTIHNPKICHSLYDNAEIQIVFEGQSRKRSINENHISSPASLQTVEVANVDANRDVNSDESDNENIPAPHNFYYHSNFLFIIKSVLAEECNKKLFNEEDIKVIDIFNDLSVEGQKLYIRLFQRKLKWLRLNKINYPEITSQAGTEMILNCLVSCNLLASIDELSDVSEATDLLFQPELKQISKNLNFNSSIKGKANIKSSILKHCQEHKSTSMFFNHSVSLERKMMKTLKDAILKCYKLKDKPRRVFTRILMLFSLPNMAEDDNDASGGQQQQLLTLLMVNGGKIKFPNYNILKMTEIFQDRDCFLRFEVAKLTENEILRFIEEKEFSKAVELYLVAKEEFYNLNTLPGLVPDFLKRFTAHHVYVRCLGHGVEILQRLKRYKEAVEQLESLLKQEEFCLDYRGRWWDRLALNYDQHLKQPEKALTVITNALKDSHTKPGYYYNLHNRAQKLLLAKTKKEVKKKAKVDSEKLASLPNFEIALAPKVTIQGCLFPQSIPGRKTVFLSKNFVESHNKEDVAMMSVEELALDHYKQNGYSEGLHAEGLTFVSIFCLLFWDEIYGLSVPDVFQSAYQEYPLDLNCPSFYVRRKDAIDRKLQCIDEATVDEIAAMVTKTWEENCSIMSLVNWNLFGNINQLLGLLKCIPSLILSGICRRLVTDFRHFKSGVPDLIVWNPESHTFKVVEIKGPGDRLSSKQIIWLDYLLKLKVAAEVCLVEAVGAKKLKRFD